ncbi:TIGR02647 family protein [Zhongshania arctica]|uniref:TIGR02647 family protein n=1 Tax=Zhongshania arctica TaxID=3238302 RepID=A0ABV3TVE4_9GAMM|tara:strand:+ start:23470 stop:23721 length:252 start_codon:yes stop_codon:yes gene_type:complete
MPLSKDILDEIRVLTQFNPASALEGIKVHHTADQSTIAATQRLYAKELITLPDGGYLTNSGQEVIRHLDSLVTVLQCKEALVA